MIDQLRPLIQKFSKYACDRFKFERPPKLFLKKDSKNSKNFLGRTAHYDPNKQSITVFITSRHPKDIMRSIAHEFIHHAQFLRGDLSADKCSNLGPGYAQSNDHMRNMEKEAYLLGNMCFRDWEDTEKLSLAESKILYGKKEKNNMTNKVTKKVLKKMILETLQKKNILTEMDQLPSEMKRQILRVVSDMGLSGPVQLSVNTDTNDVAVVAIGQDEAALPGGADSEIGPGLREPFVDGSFTNEPDSGDHPGPGSRDIYEGSDGDCGCPDLREEAGQNTTCEECGADLDAEGVCEACSGDRDRNESRILTPEHESLVYENRFTKRDDILFEKLLNKWAK